MRSSVDGGGGGGGYFCFFLRFALGFVLIQGTEQLAKNFVNSSTPDFRPTFVVNFDTSTVICQHSADPTDLHVHNMSSLCDGKQDCFNNPAMHDEIFPYCEHKCECNGNGACLYDGSKPQCYCDSGFSGASCDLPDTNECLDHPCHMMAQCKNTFGSYECHCLPGYHGDGHSCSDIDECSRKLACPENSNCINLPGTYYCNCTTGFAPKGNQGSGLEKCADIDECATGAHSCHQNEICENTEGSYKCVEKCSPGYEHLNGLCVDIDECRNEDTHKCDVRSECINTLGGYRCECDSGFIGDGKNCQPKHPCSRNPNICDRHAHCLPMMDLCVCGAGYAGDGITCNDVNECEANEDPCTSDRRCLNLDGGYVCCDASHTDSQCIKEQGAFCSGGCAPNAFCANQTCACVEGFEGDPLKKCVDINECEKMSNICGGVGDRCVNLNGGYVCCAPGSELRECQDESFSVDSATLSSHGADFTTTGERILEETGSFTTSSGGIITVKKGVIPKDVLVTPSGKLACTSYCPKNSECVNGYCECVKGFGGNPLAGCEDIDECQIETCNLAENEWCVNLDGSFVCCNPRNSTDDDNCYGLEISKDRGLRVIGGNEEDMIVAAKGGERDQIITQVIQQSRNFSTGQIVVTRGKIGNGEELGLEISAEKLGFAAVTLSSTTVGLGSGSPDGGIWTEEEDEDLMEGSGSGSDAWKTEINGTGKEGSHTTKGSITVRITTLGEDTSTQPAIEEKLGVAREGEEVIESGSQGHFERGTKVEIKGSGERNIIGEEEKRGNTTGKLPAEGHGLLGSGSEENGKTSGLIGHTTPGRGFEKMTNGEKSSGASGSSARFEKGGSVEVKTFRNGSSQGESIATKSKGKSSEIGLEISAVPKDSSKEVGLEISWKGTPSTIPEATTDLSKVTVDSEHIGLEISGSEIAGTRRPQGLTTGDGKITFTTRDALKTTRKPKIEIDGGDHEEIEGVDGTPSATRKTLEGSGSEIVPNTTDEIEGSGLTTLPDETDGSEIVKEVTPEGVSPTSPVPSTTEEVEGSGSAGIEKSMETSSVAPTDRSESSTIPHPEDEGSGEVTIEGSGIGSERDKGTGVTSATTSRPEGNIETSTLSKITKESGTSNNPSETTVEESTLSIDITNETTTPKTSQSTTSSLIPDGTLSTSNAGNKLEGTTSGTTLEAETATVSSSTAPSSEEKGTKGITPGSTSGTEKTTSPVAGEKESKGSTKSSITTFEAETTTSTSSAAPSSGEKKSEGNTKSSETTSEGEKTTSSASGEKELEGTTNSSETTSDGETPTTSSFGEKESEATTSATTSEGGKATSPGSEGTTKSSGTSSETETATVPSSGEKESEGTTKTPGTTSEGETPTAPSSGEKKSEGTTKSSEPTSETEKTTSPASREKEIERTTSGTTSQVETATAPSSEENGSKETTPGTTSETEKTTSLASGKTESKGTTSGTTSEAQTATTPSSGENKSEGTSKSSGTTSEGETATNPTSAEKESEGTTRKEEKGVTTSSSGKIPESTTPSSSTSALKEIEKATETATVPSSNEKESEGTTKSSGPTSEGEKTTNPASGEKESKGTTSGTSSEAETTTAPSSKERKPEGTTKSSGPTSEGEKTTNPASGEKESQETAKTSGTTSEAETATSPSSGENGSKGTTSGTSAEAETATPTSSEENKSEGTTEASGTTSESEKATSPVSGEKEPKGTTSGTSSEAETATATSSGEKKSEETEITTSSSGKELETSSPTEKPVKKDGRLDEKVPESTTQSTSTSSELKEIDEATIEPLHRSTKDTFSLPTTTLAPTNETENFKCTNSDECGMDALCERRTGVCRCEPGFEGVPPKTPCIDVDECANGLHKCHETARCQNHVGGYACFCATGFRKSANGSCEDIDECAEHNSTCCGENAQCVNKPGTYSCECVKGFLGDGYSCVPNEKKPCDEEQLKNARCDPNKACMVDTNGITDCNQCTNGFIKNPESGECEDIDECSSGESMCSNNAKCTNLNGTFSCACSAGYRGDGFLCTDINECDERSPCHPHADCTNLEGTFKCECQPGFQGDGLKQCMNPLERSCENLEEFCGRVDHVSCLSVRIFNGTLASICECEPGFRLDRKSNQCVDINECDENRHNCDPASTVCVNTDGSFECECAEGYEGEGGICTDIDECDRGTAGCDSMAMCINRMGSCGCKCMPGYTGDGSHCSKMESSDKTQCTDEWERLCELENKQCTVDEEEVPQCGACLAGHQPVNGSCQSVEVSGLCKDNNDCNEHADCIDIQPNSHLCVCTAGFIGDGKMCDDIDECSLSGMCDDENSSCVNTMGAFKCVCKEGFKKEESACVPHIATPTTVTSKQQREHQSTTDGKIVSTAPPLNATRSTYSTQVFSSVTTLSPDIVVSTNRTTSSSTLTLSKSFVSNETAESSTEGTWTSTDSQSGGTTGIPDNLHTMTSVSVRNSSEENPTTNAIITQSRSSAGRAEQVLSGVENSTLDPSLVTTPDQEKSEISSSMKTSLETSGNSTELEERTTEASVVSSTEESSEAKLEIKEGDVRFKSSPNPEAITNTTLDPMTSEMTKMNAETTTISSTQSTSIQKELNSELSTKPPMESSTSIGEEISLSPKTEGQNATSSTRSSESITSTSSKFGTKTTQDLIPIVNNRGSAPTTSEAPGIAIEDETTFSTKDQEDLSSPSSIPFFTSSTESTKTATKKMEEVLTGNVNTSSPKDEEEERILTTMEENHVTENVPKSGANTTAISNESTTDVMENTSTSTTEIPGSANSANTPVDQTTSTKVTVSMNQVKSSTLLPKTLEQEPIIPKEDGITTKDGLERLPSTTPKSSSVEISSTEGKFATRGSLNEELGNSTLQPENTREKIIETSFSPVEVESRARSTSKPIEEKEGDVTIPENVKTSEETSKQTSSTTRYSPNTSTLETPNEKFLSTAPTLETENMSNNGVSIKPKSEITAISTQKVTPDSFSSQPEVLSSTLAGISESPETENTGFTGKEGSTKAVTDSSSSLMTTTETLRSVETEPSVGSESRITASTEKKEIISTTKGVADSSSSMTIIAITIRSDETELPNPQQEEIMSNERSEGRSTVRNGLPTTRKTPEVQTSTPVEMASSSVFTEMTGTMESSVEITESPESEITGSEKEDTINPTKGGSDSSSSLPTTTATIRSDATELPNPQSEELRTDERSERRSSITHEMSTSRMTPEVRTSSPPDVSTSSVSVEKTGEVETVVEITAAPKAEVTGSTEKKETVVGIPERREGDDVKSTRKEDIISTTKGTTDSSIPLMTTTETIRSDATELPIPQQEEIATDERSEGRSTVRNGLSTSSIIPEVQTSTPVVPKAENIGSTGQEKIIRTTKGTTDSSSPLMTTTETIRSDATELPNERSEGGLTVTGGISTSNMTPEVRTSTPVEVSTPSVSAESGKIETVGEITAAPDTEITGFPEKKEIISTTKGVADSSSSMTTIAVTIRSDETELPNPQQEEIMSNERSEGRSTVRNGLPTTSKTPEVQTSTPVEMVSSSVFTEMTGTMESSVEITESPESEITGSEKEERINTTKGITDSSSSPLTTAETLRPEETDPPVGPESRFTTSTGKEEIIRTTKGTTDSSSSMTSTTETLRSDETELPNSQQEETLSNERPDGRSETVTRGISSLSITPEVQTKTPVGPEARISESTGKEEIINTTKGTTDSSSPLMTTTETIRSDATELPTSSVFTEKTGKTGTVVEITESPEAEITGFTEKEDTINPTKGGSDSSSSMTTIAVTIRSDATELPNPQQEEIATDERPEGRSTVRNGLSTSSIIPEVQTSTPVVPKAENIGSTRQVKIIRTSKGTTDSSSSLPTTTETIRSDATELPNPQSEELRTDERSERRSSITQEMSTSSMTPNVSTPSVSVEKVGSNEAFVGIPQPNNKETKEPKEEEFKNTGGLPSSFSTLITSTATELPNPHQEKRPDSESETNDGMSKSSDEENPKTTSGTRYESMPTKPLTSEGKLGESKFPKSKEIPSEGLLSLLKNDTTSNRNPPTLMVKSNNEAGRSNPTAEVPRITDSSTASSGTESEKNMVDNNREESENGSSTVTATSFTIPSRDAEMKSGTSSPFGSSEPQNVKDPAKTSTPSINKNHLVTNTWHQGEHPVTRLYTPLLQKRQESSSPPTPTLRTTPPPHHQQQPKNSSRIVHTSEPDTTHELVTHLTTTTPLPPANVTTRVEGMPNRGPPSIEPPFVSEVTAPTPAPALGGYGENGASRSLCANVTCHAFATCTEETGTCECNEGFVGDGVTQCAKKSTADCVSLPSLCSRNAHCDTTTRSCECERGYIGDGYICSPHPKDCVLRQNLCSPEAICQNRRCQCLPGFTGDGIKCVSIHERASNCTQCDENARCVGGTTCQCNAGYFGNGLCCVPDPLDCVHFTGICHPNAECDAVSRQCKCASGFSGNGVSCFRRKSCRTDRSVCSRHAICLPTGACICRHGFQGDGYTCTSSYGTLQTDTSDISSCLKPCDETSQLCISGECVCKQGFRETNNKCIDIDECVEQSHTCDRLASCQNTIGSHICTCPSGYIGDGTTCVPHVNDGKLAVYCEADGMTLLLGNETSDFEGKIFVKGQRENPHCSKSFSSLLNSQKPYFFKVAFQHCDVQLLENHTMGATVVVQKHALFLTNKADSFDLRCQYPIGSRAVESKVNVSELAPVSTLTDANSAPTCKLSVTNEQQLSISAATVGDTLKLSLEVVPSHGFGILPKNCFAVNIETGERYTLTDDAGCAIDESLFPQWSTVSNQKVQAVFRTFKWPDSSMIRFQCDCAPCVDHCVTPSCINGGARFRRHHAIINEEIRQELVLMNGVEGLAVSPIINVGDSPHLHQDSLKENGEEEICTKFAPILLAIVSFIVCALILAYLCSLKPKTAQNS